MRRTQSRSCELPAVYLALPANRLNVRVAGNMLPVCRRFLDILESHLARLRSRKSLYSITLPSLRRCRNTEGPVIASLD